ncbi:MAG: Proline dehydrogenase [Bacteroidetes bacterium ADurb.Bin408]|nr:MAG: Proline dehydrogenase [Bacteroidetes bacterium ADurb.Bin408]
MRYANPTARSDIYCFGIFFKAIPFAVFKVSGIAGIDLLTKVQAGITLTNEERQAFRQVEKRFDNICLKAYRCAVRVFVDAEESWIQDVIDRMTLNAMRQYNKSACIIFNTVQLYRHDRISYMHDLIETAKNEQFKVGLKLVRGGIHGKGKKKGCRQGLPFAHIS